MAAKAVDVDVTEVTLTVNLADGRSVSAPTAWYPRLLHGTSKEQGNWRLVAGGEGINWPDLAEDTSVDNLLDGKRSRESQRSLKDWMAKR